jgi:hypothetical protein
MKNKSRNLIPTILNLLAIWISIVMLTHFNIVHAATAEEEKRITQCPDGQYAGPGTGARKFLQDPYIWFVSREFAKRFCVPEQFIDDGLKGALAVAVIIKPDDRTYCGLYAGRSDVCTNKPRLLLEIYVDNRKANIPKADPSVDYFSGHIVNSGKFFGNNTERYKRHYQDEYKDPDGERRPFNPATTRTIRQQDSTMFLYVGERKGWASIEGIFIEDYYRANWVDGIDLITLDAYNFGYSDARNPDSPPDPKDPHYKEPVKKFAIAVLEGKKASPYGNAWQANDYYKTHLAYPKDYLHTIELPHKIAQIIYAYDHKQGEQFFNTIKHAITPATPSTSPAQ